MKRLRSSLVFAVAIALTVALVPPMAAPAAAAPDGQITFAVHVSLAPTWFDPAETPGVGPRIGDVPTIAGHPYLSPYEDLTLTDR